MTRNRSARPWYRRRWAAALAGAGLMLGLGPVTCQASWRARHPAPLGRSVPEVERSLARLLPVSMPLDSAARVLRAVGVETEVLEADHWYVANHPMAAGGPMLVGNIRALDTDGFIGIEGAGITIAFDSSRRLTSRRVEGHVTGM